MPLAGPVQDPVWLLVVPKGSLLRADIEGNVVSRHQFRKLSRRQSGGLLQKGLFSGLRKKYLLPVKSQKIGLGTLQLPLGFPSMHRGTWIYTQHVDIHNLHE